MLQFQRYNNLLSAFHVTWLSAQNLHWLFSCIEVRKIDLNLRFGKWRIWINFKHLRIEQDRIIGLIILCNLDMILIGLLSCVVRVGIFNILRLINGESRISNIFNIEDLIRVEVRFHWIKIFYNFATIIF